MPLTATRYRRLSMLLASLLLVISMGWVDHAAAGEIEIVDPWARATPGRHAPNGAAYLTVINRGAADRLLSVATPVAHRAEIHTTVHEGGMMRMTPVKAIDLPAGGQAIMKPGSYHVMLMGLSAPLLEGAHFPLTLTFERAGDISIEVTIMGIGAMGRGDGGGMPMHDQGPGHTR